MRVTSARRAPFVFRPASILVLFMYLIGSPGCGDSASLPPSRNPDRLTLGETIVEEDSGTGNDGDVALTSEGTEETPTLSFDAGPGFCCNPLTIEFNANLSDASESGRAVFRWDFGDGRTGRGASTQHTYAWQGDYDVTLTATMSNSVVVEASRTLSLGNDSAGSDSISLAPPVDSPPPDEQTDTDVPGGLQLTVDAGATVAALAGDIVLLSGTADTGGRAVELTYRWQQLSGPVVSLDNPSHATTSVTIPSNISTPSELVFELTVSGEGVTAGDQVAIVVSSESVPQGVTAAAGSDQVVAGGSTVLLDGSSSRGTGGGALTYHWSQSSGPAVNLSDSSSAAPSFVAPAGQANPTTLRFDLTVTQGGLSDTDAVEVTIGAVELPDTDQIVSWLQELPPLPKVHYSWPLSGFLMSDPDNPLLFEYVRITHAVTLAGGAPKKHRVEAAVRVCKAVNALIPAIPATIAIKYSPWHEIWPSHLPPTDFGPNHDEALAQFEDYMLQFRQWLDEAYMEFDAEIPMTALIFDSELFIVKKPNEPGYQEWNAAMTAKYDAFYTLGKSIFPEARIEWFARGAIQPCRDYTRWCTKNLFTLDEMGETFNCSLFYPHATQLMIDTFRQTHQNAVAHGVNEIMLWVSLGSGWDLSRRWHCDLEYDVAASWDLGAQINDPYYGDRPDEYAPWHDAPIVSFYPRPFNAATPLWGLHFVAYVRGAHGIAELP